MLKITPIQTKEEQAKLAALCSVEFKPEAMAYRAYEDDAFLGISQFGIEEGHGVLFDLAEAPDIDDFEAMFIMGRATMNFIDLLGIHTCIAYSTTADRKLLIPLGFLPGDNGIFTADMTHMFSGECGGHQVKKSTTE